MSAFSVGYNVFAIPLRSSFPVYPSNAIVGWLLIDYISDLIFLLDIVFVQLHLSFWSKGVLQVSFC